MDSKEYVEQNKQQIVEPPIISKHFHLPRVFLVLIVAILTGTFFGTFGYYIGVNKGAGHHQSQQLTDRSIVRSAPPVVITQQTTPIIITTQTNAQSSIGYVILNGDIYKVMTDEKPVLIINHRGLPSEWKQTPGFEAQILNIQLSPDGTKLAIVSQEELTSPILYYSDSNGKSLIKIGTGSKPEWAPNSQYIAFTRRPADVGPENLFVFDTSTNKEIPTNAVNGDYGYDSYEWEGSNVLYALQALVHPGPGTESNWSDVFINLKK